MSLNNKNKNTVLENKVTEAERLAVERYNKKIEAEKKLRTENCNVKLQRLLQEFNCELTVIYIPNGEFQPSIGQVAIIAK